jgi:hypothetical protein
MCLRTRLSQPKSARAQRRKPSARCGWVALATRQLRRRDIELEAALRRDRVHH